MKKTLIAGMLLLLFVTSAYAQDWQRGAKGNVKYNCDAVKGAIADVGAEYYVVRGTDTLTPGDGTAEHYILTDVNVVTVAQSLLVRAPGCGTAPETDDGIAEIYNPDAWVQNITGDYLYQCDVVRAIVAAYGKLEFRRDGDRHHTVLGFYQEDVPDCVPRYVITINHSYVLECADSDCDQLTRIMRWLAWPVVGVSEGWYEIALEDETGFVAASDVAPGPLGLLQEDEQHVLQYAECIMVPERKPEEYRYIAVIKGGPAYREMDVALYKPAIDTALEIQEEVESEFSNNGQPYILQIYSRADHFPTGVYTVELTWNGLTFRYGFHAQEHALYYIHVYCNRSAPLSDEP